MGQPEPIGNPETGGRLPWWVRLALPAGIGQRRAVLRNFCVLFLGGSALGVLFAVPAFLSEAWYRWWLIGYFALVGLLALLEWRAIRWLDRSNQWPL